MYVQVVAKYEYTNTLIPCKMGTAELDLPPRIQKKDGENNTNTNTNTQIQRQELQDHRACVK